MSIDSQPGLERAPALRRLWVVVLLTCLILTFPIAMVILLSGPVYRWRDHTWRPISNGARYTYGGLLVLWLVAATARSMLQPGGIAGEWQRAGNSTDTAPPSASKAPVAAANSNDQESEVRPAPSDSSDTANDGSGGSAPAHHLNVEVQTQETQYGPAVVLTNTDQPFTLKRIVFNGRKEEKNCDLPDYGLSAESRDTSNEAASMQSVYGTQLPKELKVGDRALFFLACGGLVKFDLYTDHGLWHFTQHDDAK